MADSFNQMSNETNENIGSGADLNFQNVDPSLQGVDSSLQNPQGSENNSQNPKDKGTGVAALILGVLSLVFGCIPCLGQILACVAIILGINSVAKNKGKKQGTAGLVMGIISLVCAIVFAVILLVNANAKLDPSYFSGTAWRRETDGCVLYLAEDGTFICAENEGDFTDNFFRGTYEVVPYKDSDIKIRAYEHQYNMKYACDVVLHVDLYVHNKTERENIASTIRYIYILDKHYEKGDNAFQTAHADTNYSALMPVRETTFAAPSGANAYIPGEQKADAKLSLNDSPMWKDLLQYSLDDTTGEQALLQEASEEATEEATTEAPVSVVDPSKESSDYQQASEDLDAAVSSASEQFDLVNSEMASLMDDMGLSTEDSPSVSSSEDSISEKGSEVASEASSAFNQASSAYEEASSAFEQASSAAEAASSAYDEASSAIDNYVPDSGFDLSRFLEKIFNWLRSLF